MVYSEGSLQEWHQEAVVLLLPQCLEVLVMLVLLLQ
jgi:hypothetical protein